jgi:hypothetical protein
VTNLVDEIAIGGQQRFGVLGAREQPDQTEANILENVVALLQAPPPILVVHATTGG